MGRSGMRPYPLADGALKIIRVRSHPVAVPFMKKEKIDYEDDEDEKGPWWFSADSWKRTAPLEDGTPHRQRP